MAYLGSYLLTSLGGSGGGGGINLLSGVPVADPGGHQGGLLLSFTNRGQQQKKAGYFHRSRTGEVVVLQHLGEPLDPALAQRLTRRLVWERATLSPLERATLSPFNGHKVSWRIEVPIQKIFPTFWPEKLVGSISVFFNKAPTENEIAKLEEAIRNNFFPNRGLNLYEGIAEIKTSIQSLTIENIRAVQFQINEAGADLIIVEKLPGVGHGRAG